MPWFGEMSVFHGASFICWIVRSSSSAAIWSRPVGVPVMSIFPVASVAVLSAWIAIHESIRLAFGGPAAATRRVAPFAEPASAEPTRLNPTTMAPPPLRNFSRVNSEPSISSSILPPSRRSMVLSLSSIALRPLRHRRGRTLDRLGDARIRAAAAEVGVHVGLDLVLGRPLHLVQELGRLDHHPVLAVAALRHLLLDPGLLDGMEVVGLRRGARLGPPEGRQALERRDRALADSGDGCDARANLLAVVQDRAGTALRETAAEARAVQAELVPQDVQQRRVGRRRDVVNASVHLDLECVRHRLSLSGRPAAETPRRPTGW